MKPTKVLIVDDLSPEDVAMLQALYSRSAESVEVHLEKVKASGSGKFMQNYYVGYGHKSIADCGSTTLFVENVSLLCAKAIQDWPLYSGQETSTRYIDMSKQRVIDPIKSPTSRLIVDEWMNFYTTKQEPVAAHVRAQYPRRPDEKEDAYERAVKARTFDILRGFLPAGITTQLSWHTNLRQAGDHLAWLIEHPAPEVRDIARQMRQLLATHYSSSGAGMSLPAVAGIQNSDGTAERLKWVAEAASEWSYSIDAKDCPVGDQMFESIRFAISAAHLDLLKKRPRGCVLPHWMTDFGRASFDFSLDFGSYRDLQRHRNGVVRMPLLDTSLGFEPWYLDQLDKQTRRDAEKLIALQTDRIRSDLGISPDVSATRVEKQYITALGYRVPCVVTMALPALLYFLELRTQKTVHPTLRTRALQMAKRFTAMWPDLALHIDRDPDDWTVRRGNQTITER